MIIQASTVTTNDVMFRNGFDFSLFNPVSLPVTPGYDAVGVVIEIGKNVLAQQEAKQRFWDEERLTRKTDLASIPVEASTPDNINNNADQKKYHAQTTTDVPEQGVFPPHQPRLKVGSRVATLVRTGGNARYVSVPAARCILIPQTVDWHDAVSLVSVYSSAYLGLQMVTDAINKEMTALAEKQMLCPGSDSNVQSIDIDLPQNKSTNKVSIVAETPDNKLIKKTASSSKIEGTRLPLTMKGALKGRKVLVTGAMDVIGQAIVHLCSTYGKADKVYATASVSDHSFLQRLGATPLSRNEAIWLPNLEGTIDIVFDGQVPGARNAYKTLKGQNPTNNGSNIDINNTAKPLETKTETNHDELTNGLLICYAKTYLLEEKNEMGLFGAPLSAHFHEWMNSFSSHKLDLWDYASRNLVQYKKNLHDLMMLVKYHKLRPSIGLHIGLVDVTRAHQVTQKMQARGVTIVHPWRQDNVTPNVHEPVERSVGGTARFSSRGRHRSSSMGRNRAPSAEKKRSISRGRRRRSSSRGRKLLIGNVNTTSSDTDGEKLVVPTNVTNTSEI
jgi:NADPH:quinone reductase-like Zn-dependent oxidoreductase